MAAVQNWRMQGLTRKSARSHSHPLRTNVQSPCCLHLFLFPYLCQYCFFSPSSSFTRSLFLTHTHSHIYGGSFIFDHDPCPVCPTHSHTETQIYTLVVSCGLVRGCGVYCGEDVQSCRLKSLTSLVPAGGLCTILTDFAHARADCAYDMWFWKGMSAVDNRLVCLVLNSVSALILNQVSAVFSVLAVFHRPTVIFPWILMCRNFFFSFSI